MTAGVPEQACIFFIRSITCLSSIAGNAGSSLERSDELRTRLNLSAMALAVGLCGLAPEALAAPTELTIEVGGDLLEHGGVVVLYSMPVPAARMREIAGAPFTRIRLDGRYAEVQLRFVKADDFVVRFRAVTGTQDEDKLATEALSVIGTDMEGRGPQMTAGFKDDYYSGGQVIRVLPRAKYAAADEVTRSMARWGETQGYDAVPPADRSSARILEGIISYEPERAPPLQCRGDELVQTCTIAADQWPALEARWWRAIAESRLGRLDHYALRRCYDSNRSWTGTGTCERDTKSDEPEYIHKN